MSNWKDGACMQGLAGTTDAAPSSPLYVNSEDCWPDAESQTGMHVEQVARTAQGIMQQVSYRLRTVPQMALVALGFSAKHAA